MSRRLPGVSKAVIEFRSINVQFRYIVYLRVYTIFSEYCTTLLSSARLGDIYYRRVKSFRNFNHEIERSGLTRDIYSQSLLLRLKRISWLSLRKLTVFRRLSAHFDVN